MLIYFVVLDMITFEKDLLIKRKRKTPFEKAFPKRYIYSVQTQSSMKSSRGMKFHNFRKTEENATKDKKIKFRGHIRSRKCKNTSSQKASKLSQITQHRLISKR